MASSTHDPACAYRGEGDGCATPFASADRHAIELEAIFRAHADGLVIYGPDGEIRSMNPAAREMFGVREGEPPSYRQAMEPLAPVDATGERLDPAAQPSRRAMRGEGVKGFVMGVQTAKGRVWLSASAAPLRAADGEVVGAVLSCVDVTHLRQLAEERERVIRTLTHDARTRLNVIRTHAELLGRGESTDEDVRRRGGAIAANTCRLADLIDGLVER